MPPLDTLRGIHGGYGERDMATPVALTFGLYQGAKLGIAATDAYTHALNRLLLPRLLTRLETRLQSSMSNLDFLYQSLKVYLILGRQGPLDKELVSQWLQGDLLAAYPGEDMAPLRELIMTHVDALLEHPLEPIPLNDALIAQARAALDQGAARRIQLQPADAQQAGRRAAGLVRRRKRRAGRRPRVPLQIRQAARHRPPRDLHLGRIPLRLPNPAAARDAGRGRGRLGPRPREAGRCGRAA